MVLFLVFVGGIVRSTGAGMGCPDWPKCFGSWVPPTKAEDVPLEYWNNPLSSKDGFLIFNPVKTWIEYLNRLLGVFIGFSIFIQLVFAFLARANTKSLIFSLLAFLLVAFQGLLGAKVVSTDLRPLVITIHLLVALLIGLVLVLALHFARNQNGSQGPFYKGYLPVFVLLILFLQFFLGTEVRAQVDLLFKQFAYENRFVYSDLLDWKFWIHRSFSILAISLLMYQIFVLGRFMPIQELRFLFFPFLMSLVLILTGILLVYFGFPAWAQPIHLTLGFAILCAQLWLILILSRNQNTSHAPN